MNSKKYLSLTCAALTIASTAFLLACSGSNKGTVYGNVMYYMAGYSPALAPSKKVFISKNNGVTWTEVGTNALNIAVTQPMCFFYNNKIWLVGGSDGAASIDEVQSSADGGLTWTTHSNVLPSILQGSTFGKIGSTHYVIGGVDSANTNVIFSSTNGSTWSNTGATLGAVAGGIHSSVIFDNKIWIAGGQPAGTSSKVTTFDGTTAVTSPAGGLSDIPVSGSWFSGYVIGSRLYFANGAQILSTTNGSTWVNETVTNGKSLPINSSFGHQILVHDSAAYLMGGFIAALQSGVYKSLNGVDWTQVGSLPEIKASGCTLSVSIPQSVIDTL